MFIVDDLVIAGLVATAVGAGTSVYGSSKSASAQKQQIDAERSIEAQKRRRDELDARRRQMEFFRHQQQARSIALVNATSQGASQGSGLQGGYGQISGATGENLLGVTGNLEIGRNIFDLNAQLSNAKLAQASAQSISATGQGLSQLGGALISSAGAYGRLSQIGANPATQGASALPAWAGGKFGTLGTVPGGSFS